MAWGLWLQKGLEALRREGCNGEQGGVVAVDSVIRGGSPAAYGLGKSVASGDSAQAQW